MTDIPKAQLGDGPPFGRSSAGFAGPQRFCHLCPRAPLPAAATVDPALSASPPPPRLHHLEPTPGFLFPLPRTPASSCPSEPRLRHRGSADPRPVSMSPSWGAPGTTQVTRERGVSRIRNDEGLPLPPPPCCVRWGVVPGGEQGSLRPHLHGRLVDAGSRRGRVEVPCFLGSCFFKRSQKFWTFGQTF